VLVFYILFVFFQAFFSTFLLLGSEFLFGSGLEKEKKRRYFLFRYNILSI
jgi:hypothetical protein